MYEKIKRKKFFLSKINHINSREFKSLQREKVPEVHNIKPLNKQQNTIGLRVQINQRKNRFLELERLTQHPKSKRYPSAPLVSLHGLIAETNFQL